MHDTNEIIARLEDVIIKKLFFSEQGDRFNYLNSGRTMLSHRKDIINRKALEQQEEILPRPHRLKPHRNNASKLWSLTMKEYLPHVCVFEIWALITHPSTCTGNIPQTCRGDRRAAASRQRLCTNGTRPGWSSAPRSRVQ